MKKDGIAFSSSFDKRLNYICLEFLNHLSTKNILDYEALNLLKTDSNADILMLNFTTKPCLYWLFEKILTCVFLFINNKYI